MADQHRWDFTGYESNGVTLTPNLDNLARTGITFKSAYCTAPLCSPSRESIASGRYCMSTGCFTNLHELPPGTPTFVGQLRNAGYRTCAVGKTHMEIHAYDSDLTSKKHRRFMDSLGWDEVCEVSGNGMLKTGIKCAYTQFLRKARKFDDVLNFYKKWVYFMDKGRAGVPDFTSIEWPFDEHFQEARFVADRALDWLKNRPRSEPFFLHVGFPGPHSPIEPFPRFMDLYRNKEEPLPWGVGNCDNALLDARRGYRVMISQIDEYVGEICTLLEQQGDLQNTVIVYLSDHGEMAGDLGRIGKTCFYEASVRVPLLMSGPGIARGKDSTALVELIDVGKTICELCSVEPHALDQGRNLLPLLHGETEILRDTVYCEMGPDRMLCDGRSKLMWGDPGSETRKLGRIHLDRPVNIPPAPPRLYDLSNDPHELHDLSADPASAGLLHDMKTKLLVRINENTQMLPFKSRREYKPL